MFKYYLGGQMKKHEMSATFGTYRREEGCTEDFSEGSLKERGHLEDFGVEGRKTLKMDLQEVGWGEAWNDLAQDRYSVGLF
jgi:hypothetical protein